ncbi:scarecrow-like protein 21 [Phalaenopsis equestris]|uniref:scarecrow-like protein 21 n=1 Tax=Phalaenopsis equestris TaxID=78828 RepID=UPI0009E5D6E7|nr:scarecrow-like protein 21 [Phalaenopsis equestris]
MQATRAAMKKLSPQSPNFQYFTLESSSAVATYTYCSPSPPSLSSPNESHSDQTHGSPMNSSSSTSDSFDLSLKLKELESLLLWSDCNKLLIHIPKDLKEILISCARALAEDDILNAEWLIAEAKQMVSVFGEPFQRVAAYMLEGLVARLSSSGSAIYKSLICREPASSDLLSYMHLLYEVCPCFKFGYLSANGAIADAVRNEEKVHIIDFQMAHGGQWATLIQALATRPGGPPHLRITGIVDSTTSAAATAAAAAGRQLSRLAESCNVPFEFRSASAIIGCEFKLENVDIRRGEALAVNFAFQLHRMPDESVSTWNHRDRLLRLVKSLAPKVVTVVEQESNTNTSAFFPRFMEALDYYTAIFESIDATLSRTSKERIAVEQHCLARDIVNVIACEGAERVERHEVHGKWRARFRMAGFVPYPLSSLVIAAIRALLENYCGKYGVEERDEALYLGWMERALVVSSAWR